jgi:NAD(P)-dependent dehydrogenase (short-subunit alcohol dehydrogenase family)
MDLKGTGTLITGGSRGLGAALGRALAARGARVVLVARPAAPLDEVVGAIRAAGGEAHALVGDLGDKEATYALAGCAQRLAGPIDLLVHNASTLGPLPMPLVLDTACEDLERVLAVNLVGPFRLSKAIVGSMVLRGRGLVVHVTSDAAVEAYPRWGAYGVSKAALEQLARSFAVELAGSGVRSLRVDPGEMDTQMHADALPDAERARLRDPARVAAELAALLAGERPALFDERRDHPDGARVELVP